jgi:ATP-dependent Clp protease ATP-binding subunit ClpC
MFERYTESARRALFFARYEVSQLGATSIDPEHVLLGVARAAKGVTARILEDAGVSADGLRREIADRSAQGEKTATSLEIPFSQPTQRVLQFAAEQADRLAHPYIGPEHLLLGLLREDGSMAASILHGHGLKLTEVRSAVERLSLASPDIDRSSPDRAVHAAHEIDHIKASVDALAVLPADSGEARDLRQAIRERLEGLKRYLCD